MIKPNPDPSWEDVSEWMKEGVEQMIRSVAQLQREQFRRATEAFLDMPEEEWQKAVEADQEKRSREKEHEGE